MTVREEETPGGAGTLKAEETCPCVCLLPKPGHFIALFPVGSCPFYIVSGALASL